MQHTLSVKQERTLLMTLSGIQFSHILDFMIMMPLGPILIATFDITTHEFGLLVASYGFAAAISGLLVAAFVDKFERKHMLLVMFSLFGLATLACGLAPGYTTLLIARCMAGAFGGIIGTMVHTIVGDVIPFARRAKASGIIAASFSLSTVAGVPLSLWLANLYDWRAPFISITVLVVLFIILGLYALPELKHHISPSPATGSENQTHLFSSIFTMLGDVNHLRALMFSALTIFSGFLVIPYITVYAVHNVGIQQSEIPLIYLLGGAATLVTARLIGHWADQHGKVEVYRIVALTALLPLFIVTNIGAAPLWLWISCTTIFFVLVSGRMIPGMAIITSAAQPKLRGTFMSLNGTTQALAMALASTLAGFMLSQNVTGEIVDYEWVGYVAITANILAIWFVPRIVMHDQNVVIPDVVPKQRVE
jgi:predicted MFS family arabinose efflux permease